MNRFSIRPCISQSELDSELDGFLLPLTSEIQNNCVLFFPVTEEIGALVNGLLETGEVDATQYNTIDIFNSMINTWKSGERFLSGIFLDASQSEDGQDGTISVSMILSSASDGYVEAVVKMNIIHAMIIAILEDIDIMVSDDLLDRLLPDTHEKSEDDFDEKFEDLNEKLDDNIFPVDQNISDIVRKILDGEIK